MVAQPTATNPDPAVSGEAPDGAGQGLNRQQRRNQERLQRKAAKPTAAGAKAAALFTEAFRHHQAGRIADAERLYREVLALDTRHADAFHLLGLIAMQVGRADAAAELIGQAVAIRPNFPEALSNLGNALRDLRRLDEAAARYEQALEIRPDYAEAHANLGTTLMEQGKLDAAIARFQAALKAKPQFPVALYNLGNALFAQGRLEEAAARYREALALHPHFPEALANLGNTLRDLGRLQEAVDRYMEALGQRPNFPQVLDGLGIALMDGGQPAQAMTVALRNLALGETPKVRALFMAAAKSYPAGPAPMDAAEVALLRPLVVRALTEGWGRTRHAAGFALTLLKQSPDLAAAIARAAAAWPERLPAAALLGPLNWRALAEDGLLIGALQTTMLFDVGMERFLTGLRHALLARLDDGEAVDEAEIAVACALARHCFLNDYVFALTGEEVARVAQLRATVVAALEGGQPVSPLALAVLAQYEPLRTLSGAERLLAASWPESVRGLLTVQVAEPLEERRLGAALPSLTPISDGVSQLVREQYEENPYPRWLTAATPDDQLPFDAQMRRIFPHAAFRPLGQPEGFDLLIAGCGTGQHSIETALNHAEARVLAIDLSRASLGYAARKTKELGIPNLSYAQADILQLGAIGRTFDVIESVGVLHHLEDWRRGWRTLLTLLRPGGFMRLGFYSALARQSVVTVRDLIAERGYGQSAEGIRACRQDLLAAGPDAPWNRILTRGHDFYSTNECRDLLFHVQEHRLTIPEIQGFLAENGLSFLGFELDGRVLQAYRARFPEDIAARDLGRWHALETEHPDIFLGMYQFWVQKAV